MPDAALFSRRSDERRSLRSGSAERPVHDLLGARRRGDSGRGRAGPRRALASTSSKRFERGRNRPAMAAVDRLLDQVVARNEKRVRGAHAPPGARRVRPPRLRSAPRQASAQASKAAGSAKRLRAAPPAPAPAGSARSESRRNVSVQSASFSAMRASRSSISAWSPSCAVARPSLARMTSSQPPSQDLGKPVDRRLRRGDRLVAAAGQQRQQRLRELRQVPLRDARLVAEGIASADGRSS